MQSLTLAKILIVDDVPANIRVLAESLHQEYRVQVAISGEKAMAILESEEEKPDIILLDVMMPNMDGYETCRLIKSHESLRNIPIIFVTALGDEADEEKGLNLGAIDYLTKPINIPITKARIRNHITSKRRADMLEAMAHIDALTGIANRRCFENSLEQELRRGYRAGSVLSFLMIDIDFFKLYNDHYGHGAGDDCLRRVAQGLQQAMPRSGDALFRYGGEEFAAILPATELAGAMALAERIRQHIFSLNIANVQSSQSNRVTISIGCASMVPTREGGRSRLLTAADHMLYKAKQQGRNQVCGEIIGVDHGP